MSFESIIERQLECLYPDGSCRTIRLRIGRPYCVPGSDWCCPVAVDGGHGELRPIYGIDSWQALLLALRLLEGLLAAEMEGGAILHWPPGDGEAIDIAELFSRSSHHRKARDCGGEQEFDEI